MLKVTIAIVLSFWTFIGCSSKSPSANLADQYSVSTVIDLQKTPNVGKPDHILAYPAGITKYQDSLFFTDSYNHTIDKVDLKTGQWRVVVGHYGEKGGVDGSASVARFNYPYGLVNDGHYLYVADSGNSAIRKVDLKTFHVTTLMGNLMIFGSRDGDQKTGLLYHPYGLVLDGNYLYVADTGNATIRRIDLKSLRIKTLAGLAGVAGMQDGIGKRGRFHTPKGITSDEHYLYVADSVNGSIRKIDKKTDEVTTLAGTLYQLGSADGQGSSARFNNPSSLLLMGSSLIVADTTNNIIRRVNLKDAMVTTMIGKPHYPGIVTFFSFLPCVRASMSKGDPGFINGPASKAKFNGPYGLYIDGKKIYVTDSKNHAIRLIQ